MEGSPYINHFLQPDTLIPDLSNPQSWNRFSYVRNNPIRFNDPTGHREHCEDENCDQSVPSPEEELKIRIKYRFNWNIKDGFKLKDLQTIYKTGEDIQKYADGITNGAGNAWMLKYLGNTTIAPKSDAGVFWQTLTPGQHITLPGDRYSPNTIYLGTSNFTEKWITHEFGHIWDINTGYPTPLGVVGGVGDQLNSAIQGGIASTLDSRMANPNDGSTNEHIPSTDILGMVDLTKFKNNASGGYGNGSTADYLAESFAWNVIDSSKTPIFPSNWVNQMIIAQAGALP